MQHIASLIHQLQSIAILKELREFFNKDPSNSIIFWDCPSDNKWLLHSIVNKESKEFNLTPLLPCKSSWDFKRKSECDNILKQWKMIFQASDDKGRHFLDLLNNNLCPIEPSYTKGGSWIKYFRHSNLLCVRATRAIVNHTPIGEYCLCFFYNKDFSCPCSNYLIETRHHILHDCRRFNNYWNLRCDTFMLFLEFNKNAFSFGQSIT